MASQIVENMKKKYFELIAAYSRNKPQHTLLRDWWVELAIKRILASKCTHQNINKKPKLKHELENYDVITIDNKHTLVKLTKEVLPGTQRIPKVVISLESSFEIVLNAHLCTRHGSTNDMFDWIEKHKLAIASLCAPILREVCMSMNKNCRTGNVEGLRIEPTAGLKQLPDSHPTAGTVSVAILDMSLQPDNSFQYLLVYKDLGTQFIQLRPLTATCLVDEIAMELIKLFCDFSPPKAVMVDTKLKGVFTLVMERLKTVFHKISLIGSDKVGVDRSIQAKLAYWMQSKESSNWSIGCHFVQWDLNNTKANYRSAFEKFFGIETEDDEPAAAKFNKRRTPDILKVTENDSQRSNATQNNQILNNVHRNERITEITRSNDTDISKIKTESSHIKSNPAKHVQYSGHDIKRDIIPDLGNPTTSNTNSFDVQNPGISKSPERVSDVFVEAGTQVCCICELVITDMVYFCCVCRKSLHLYCGARKGDPKGHAESVCFLCL